MSTYPYPLGAFSKGTHGAVAINFARSAGTHCGDQCRFKREGGCYAAAFERLRPTLVKAATRREDDPVSWIDDVVAALSPRRLRCIPWVRFSAFGAMPSPDTLNNLPELTEGFATLSHRLDPSRTHFPVESEEKAEYYTALGFKPRLSLSHGPDDLERANTALDRGWSVSLVSPINRGRRGWQARSKTKAREWARKLRKRWPDRKMRVCPAVIGNAKCGDCRLCASGPGTADVVIYPEHR